MTQLSDKTKSSISNQLQKTLGVSYEEYIKLDFDEQQKLISEYHKKNKSKRNNEVITMIGSGEHSIFTTVKKGKLVMVGSGEDSCFVRAGISLEEARRELDDKMDDALYSKPVALVKKLQRRLKK